VSNVFRFINYYNLDTNDHINFIHTRPPPPSHVISLLNHCLRPCRMRIISGPNIYHQLLTPLFLSSEGGIQYFLAPAHHQINANNPTPAITHAASKLSLVSHRYQSGAGDGTIHVANCDGHYSGKEENHTDEKCPAACPDIDVPRGLAEINGSGSKILRPDNLKHR
jgi:hypothetical protein